MAKDLRNIIRLHEWHVDEKRRELGSWLHQVEMLEAQARNLEEELKREQYSAAAAPVEAGFLYGNYARQVIERRHEIAEALAKSEEAVVTVREALRDAHQELKKYEIAKANRDRLAAEELDRKEQITLDELGIQAHRRRRT